MPVNTLPYLERNAKKNCGYYFAVWSPIHSSFTGNLERGNTAVFSSPPLQIKIPLCQVDLAQNISEWKDVQSNKEDDEYLVIFLKNNYYHFVSKRFT